MKTVIAAATCTTFAVLAFGPMPLVAGLAAQAQHSALGDARGEAADRANALFGTYRARCGSVAVVAIDVAAAPAGGFAGSLESTQAPVRNGHTLYVALADLRLDARETTSPADRRNGIDWSGRLTFGAGSVRQISVGRDGTMGRWTPWQAGSPVYAVDLARRDGGWSHRIDEMPVVTGLGRYGRLRRPTCSEVPAG